jgi:CheY-like chemotaxis protein
LPKNEGGLAVHAISLAGVRVLLVDDNELVRESLHEFFLECGAAVVAADSARMALEVFKQAPPDVLVSDLRMPPGEDGFWLIAAIRALSEAQGGQVPAVAVTGDVLAASQAMGAGFHAVHGKPPRLPDLAVLVARLAGVP